jgi:transcriptional regulator with XRE-family HTH domain
MSQGNLADKLDVSRQTISKWENNMCLPEAEKLLQLSEIFGVSTDYILIGKTEAQTAPEPVYIYVKDPDSENASKYNEKLIKKYLGVTLAIVGIMLTILLCLLGGWPFSICTIALAVLGVLYNKNIKHPWLIVSWLTYIMMIVMLPFCTAINPLMIFNPLIYTSGYTLHLLWGWGIWIVLAILILCTIKAKRGYIFKKKQ